MPTRPPKTKRLFASGWQSDADASIMALIWQLQKPEGQREGHNVFEAEVIRGVDKIALIEGTSVEELRRLLDEQFGSPSAAAALSPPGPTVPESPDVSSGK